MIHYRLISGIRNTSLPLSPGTAIAPGPCPLSVVRVGLDYGGLRGSVPPSRSCHAREASRSRRARSSNPSPRSRDRRPWTAPEGTERAPEAARFRSPTAAAQVLRVGEETGPAAALLGAHFGKSAPLLGSMWDYLLLSNS